MSAYMIANEYYTKFAALLIAVSGHARFKHRLMHTLKIYCEAYYPNIVREDPDWDKMIEVAQAKAEGEPHAE